MIVKEKLGRVLAGAAEVIGSLDGLDQRMAAFHRAVLFIVFAVAAGRTVYAFLHGPSPASATDAQGAAWVYLSLAIITALSIVAHQRQPAFRTCAFALPTMALGASFLLLDFRTRLGWIILIGTAVAATPLIVHEALRACTRHGRAPGSGAADGRR